MTVENKIAKNTIVQAIGRGVAIGVALITLGVMTRYLGTDGYGQYVTILAFLQVFAILADLGLQMTSVQSISEEGIDEIKVLSNIFTLRFFSALAALILAPLFVLLFPYPSSIKIGIVIAALAFFISSFSSVLVGVFQKFLMMGKIAFADVVNKIVILLFTLITVYFNFGLYGILFALIAGNLAQFLITFYYSQKLIKISWQIDLSLWKKTLIKALPLAATIALNLLYFKGDTVILSIFRSQTEVGLYGAPYRVLEVLINLVYVFLGLLLPLLTLYYTSQNWDRLKKIMQLGYDMLVIISLPLILGTIFLGSALMTFIAGNDFFVSGQILKILVLATVAIFFAALFGYLIVAANQQKRVVKFYLINAVISLIAYFIFIPKYGFWAAAVITVFSELFILVSAIYIVNKFYKFKPNLTLTKKSFLAALAMSLVLYFVSDFHIAISLSLGALTYVVCLYLLKGFSKEMIMEIVTFKK